MPRYFFNTTNGIHVRDTVGVELDNHAAARVKAIQLTGHLLSEEPDYLWDGHNFRVEVTDPSGSLLLTVVSLAIDATASRMDTAAQVKRD